MPAQLELIEGASDIGDELDYWATPRSAFDAIAPVLLELPERGDRWCLVDPAAGEGALLDYALHAGLEPCTSFGVELNPRRAQVANERLSCLSHVATADFLHFDHLEAFPGTRGLPLLFTMNPPFSKPTPTIGADLVVRALELAKPTGGVVASLLPLDFATGVDRSERIHDRYLGSVYPLRRRPNFGGPNASGKRPVAWFVWDTFFPKAEWRVIG